VSGSIEYAIRPLAMVEDLPAPSPAERVVISSSKPTVSLYLSQAWTREVDDLQGSYDVDACDTSVRNIATRNLELSGRTAGVPERLDERALNVSCHVEDAIITLWIVESILTTSTKVQTRSMATPVQTLPHLVGIGV
jgi:hypothetical protein